MKIKMSASIFGISFLCLIIAGAANALLPDPDYPADDIDTQKRPYVNPFIFTFIFGKKYNLTMRNAFDDKLSLPKDSKNLTDLYSNISKSSVKEFLSLEDTDISTMIQVFDSLKKTNSPIHETANLVTNETSEDTHKPDSKLQIPKELLAESENTSTSVTDTELIRNFTLSTENVGHTDSNTTNSTHIEDKDGFSSTDSGLSSTIINETQWTMNSSISESISTQSTISTVDIDNSTPDASSPMVSNPSDDTIDIESNSTEKDERQTTKVLSTSWPKDTTESSENSTDDVITISYQTSIITTDESNEGRSTPDSVLTSDLGVRSTNTHKVSISETESETNDERSTQYFTSSSDIDFISTNTHGVSISESASELTEKAIWSTSDFSSPFSQIVERTTESGHSTVDELTPTGTKDKTVIIPKQHLVRISAIHTVKIALSVVFLVVALIATAVLAIYVIKTRRREVEYDQLTLLP